MFVIAQSVDDLSKIATGNYTTTGVLLLVLVVVGFAFWKFCSWGGKHVDTVVAKVIALLDDLRQHLGTVDETMKSISSTLDSQGEVLANVASKVDEVSRRVDDLDRHIGEIREKTQ